MCDVQNLNRTGGKLSEEELVDVKGVVFEGKEPFGGLVDWLQYE